MTFAIAKVVPDRPSRPLPRFVLIVVGVGRLAFVATYLRLIWPLEGPDGATHVAHAGHRSITTFWLS